MPRVNPSFLVFYVDGKPDSDPHETSFPDAAAAHAAAAARRDELIAANVGVGPLRDQVDGDGSGCIVPAGTPASVEGGVQGGLIVEWTSAYSVYFNGPLGLSTSEEARAKR